MSEYMLEAEQQELLITLVEASRNVSRDKRQEFRGMRGDDEIEISHPGLPNKKMRVLESDIIILSHAGLLSPLRGSGITLLFDVSQEGFKNYEQMKRQSGQPIQRVETMVRNYLSSDIFQKKYVHAYQKWIEAEELLWGGDSKQQSTVIGHCCREAMQEFATALVDQYQPPQVSENKANDVARIRAVLELHAAKFGKTGKVFLEALLNYWGTVIDLVQRQEHGAQKEGTALVWEDARRVVFQVAIVMFEIDSSLAHIG